MREFATVESIHDREYRDAKRNVVVASANDGQRLDYLEHDVQRYDNLDDLRSGAALIASRISGDEARGAALRLRDLTVFRVIQETINNKASLEEWHQLKQDLLQFPFSKEDLRARAYRAFDVRMENICMAMMGVLGGHSDEISELRTIISAYPFIDPQVHTRVLEALKKEEGALKAHRRLN